MDFKLQVLFQLTVEVLRPTVTLDKRQQKESISEGNHVILKRSKEKVKYKYCICRDYKNLRTSKPDK